MKKAINSILNFSPSCPQEETDKQLFLDCLTNIPNCLTRESLLAHFTASAFVINKSKTKVISGFHNIYKSWGWLGGHADGDDDFLHVARKEVEEESGVKNLSLLGDGIFSLESLCVFSHMKNGKFIPSHVHLNVTYVFIADENENLRIQPDENSNIAWLTFDELLSKSTEPWMLPTYEKIINKLSKGEN